MVELYLSPLSGRESLYARTVERLKEDTTLISTEDVYKICSTLAGLASHFKALDAVKNQVGDLLRSYHRAYYYFIIYFI